MVSFFAEMKNFRLWPKTMDYSQGFGPKLRSFFVVLLLRTGRCCEAKFVPFCSYSALEGAIDLNFVSFCSP